MEKEVILTKNVALPKGPYSQAIKAGNFIFVSGQGAWDSKTGNLIAPGDIIAQTEIIIKNIKLILEAADCTLDDIVKTNVFIKDLKKFSKYNDVYKRYFLGNCPARTTVRITDFEEGMEIEMDVIAFKK
jgi:2-iminobutanoate/2-iminopropanoate deaminase